MKSNGGLHAPSDGARKRGALLRQIGLWVLALVFTIGLTFASVELPYVVDQLLIDTVHTPGFDSQAGPLSRFQADLYINHYHLRTIGYACFGLTLLLIVAGFVTRRAGLAALGALAFMLPVFAQFAGVMFFLAGLGLLNIIWLPMLDISFGMQDLGMVIRAPFDFLMWIGRLLGVNLYWPIVYATIGGGLLIFFLGTVTWLTSRTSDRPVAKSWVYRISRHPQYLGWILWSYGLFLLILLARYPKRSWGISASLPWLISTMIIVGVAMLEELNMKKTFGEAYESYRKATPFLFPLPILVRTAFALPFRWLFGKWIPERRREVVIVLTGYTVVLLIASHLAYGGGWRSITGFARSATAVQAELDDLSQRLRDEAHPRYRGFLRQKLETYGEEAAGHVVALLGDPDPGVRQEAVIAAGRIGSPRAIPALLDCLNHDTPDVRARAAQSLASLRSLGAVEPIGYLLDDPVGYVRRAAAGALADLGAASYADRLISGLQDPDMWVRIDYANALGTLGQASAVTPIAMLLDDPEVGVRRAAVTSLARIRSPDTREPLQHALKDEDWEVRIFAAEALNLIE